MAFTTIKGANSQTTYVRLDEGNASDGPNPYFHPKDIARVLNQTGVVGVQVVNAIVGIDANERECFVLIGLLPDEQGVPDPDNRAVNLNATGTNSGLAALPCPPFNHDDDSNDPMTPPIPA